MTTSGPSPHETGPEAAPGANEPIDATSRRVGGEDPGYSHSAHEPHEPHADHEDPMARFASLVGDAVGEKVGDRINETTVRSTGAAAVGFARTARHIASAGEATRGAIRDEAEATRNAGKEDTETLTGLLDEATEILAAQYNTRLTAEDIAEEVAAAIKEALTPEQPEPTKPAEPKHAIGLIRPEDRAKGPSVPYAKQAAEIPLEGRQRKYGELQKETDKRLRKEAEERARLTILNPAQRAGIASLTDEDVTRLKSLEHEMKNTAVDTRELNRLEAELDSLDPGVLERASEYIDNLTKKTDRSVLGAALAVVKRVENDGGTFTDNMMRSLALPHSMRNITIKELKLVGDVLRYSELFHREIEDLELLSKLRGVSEAALVAGDRAELYRQQRLEREHPSGGGH